MADKVIITNISALKGKYGAKGLSAIKKAVNTLIAADKKRGLNTDLIALDDETQMKNLNASVVKVLTDTRQNKEAVDGIYKALKPDYIMLLGSVDVIPHQDLQNPVWSPGSSDPDKFAYGDIPYACDAPYSTHAKSFVGPTRVVGRLPDLTGADDPKYLLDLLKVAANWKALPQDKYTDYFGITANVWRESTKLSLKFIFGNSAKLNNCPPEGPTWQKTELNSRMHFFNAHGDDSAPEFYGQESDESEDTPVCYLAKQIQKAGFIVEGTVATAECCYGGQLYNPEASDGQKGIAYTYLARKAYGFFGSSTIAYGPADKNSDADLICKFFLRSVLNGASLGRAALEARQRFVKESKKLSPTELKTLAQFNLLGDPSITPVEMPAPKVAMSFGVMPKGAKGKSAKMTPAAKKVFQLEGAVDRRERRERLASEGLFLAKTIPVVSEEKDAINTAAKKVFNKLMKQLNMTETSSFSSVVESPAESVAKQPETRDVVTAFSFAPQALSDETTTYHVMTAVPATKKKTASSKSVSKKATTVSPDKKRSFTPFVVLEAKEVGGKIVSVRATYSK